jgi:hypothetical protein
LLVLLLAAPGLGAQTAAAPRRARPAPARPAEVVVLATLHQFHAEIRAYSFETLSSVIERLKPDVLAVELTDADLRSRREQQTKVEYPRSVFPLLDRKGYAAVALEPPEPKFSQLVQRFRRAGQELRATAPDRAAAFGTYQEALYAMLFERWTSVEAVNSVETDALLEAKHRYQEALFGAEEVEAWEGWNQHFLEQILRASAEHRGQRIVVLVGVEHAYWLRARLRGREDVRLVEPAVLLARSGGEAEGKDD